MKKNLLYLFMLICSVSLFTGCSDDDDNGGGDLAMALQSSVVGTYEGDLRVVLPALQLDNTQKRKIFVKADGQENVQLVLRDFSIEVAGNPVTVGDIDVSGIVLSGDVSNVQLEEKKVIISHPDLGELPVTVSGNVASGKANLSIQVVWNSMDIDVTFAGDRISTEVDDSDYAKELVGWYAQESITATGAPEDLEMKWPGSLGIEFTYAGYNKINVKQFYVSFPPQTERISIENVAVEKETDGTISIAEVKKTIEGYSNKDEELSLVFSGFVKDGKPTLNISLKSSQYDITYVYVGELKKLTGAAIESFTIVGDVVKVQPEMDDKRNVVFFVKKGAVAEQLKLVPAFTVSEGAKVMYNDAEYVAGTPVDFSVEQTFEVVSQKGDNFSYTVTYREWTEPFAMNFDEWEQQNEATDENKKYYAPVGGWSSSNGGVEYLKNMGGLLEMMAGVNPYPADKPYAVVQTDDSKSGSAARLESLDTKGVKSIFGFPAVPKVTSGSVFNGFFKVETDNTLRSTRFGDPCDREPKSFTGSYKYTSGEVYYEALYPRDTQKANEVKEVDKKDTPAINAVLYEVDTYAFDYLDGTNLLTSDKVVAIASVKYDEAAEAGKYIDFNVGFTYKDGKSWDASKKYKLAIVCSSSKDGDKFSGAPGSVLYVDDLKVSF